MILVSGCGARVTDQDVATPLASITTPTLPLTTAPASSDTALPPPPQTSMPAVQGTTATQLNVRSDPSTAGSVLGMITPETVVEIVGKDPSGSWWQILYPQGVDGKGWVTAQYVTVADTSTVPVVGAVVSAEPGQNAAIVQQQINVRSGPGTGFNSLGTLNPQDVVSLTGKDPNSTWLQIDYPPGPDGKGWVNAGFVRAQGVENLPIVSEAGQVVGTGTPTAIPATPTPTVIPAPTDNDSERNPIVSVTFAPSGTRTLIYNGDVSAPEGDKDDWIRFVPFSRQVLLDISCKGSSLLLLDVTQGQQPLVAGGECGSRQVIPVVPDLAADIHIYATSEAIQVYSSYTIKVETIP